MGLISVIVVRPEAHLKWRLALMAGLFLLPRHVFEFVSFLQRGLQSGIPDDIVLVQSRIGWKEARLASACLISANILIVEVAQKLVCSNSGGLGGTRFKSAGSRLQIGEGIASESGLAACRQIVQVPRLIQPLCELRWSLSHYVRLRWVQQAFRSLDWSLELVEVLRAISAVKITLTNRLPAVKASFVALVSNRPMLVSEHGLPTSCIAVQIRSSASICT